MSNTPVVRHAQVDDIVIFASEVRGYTVQARSDRFLVCTKPYRRSVIYSIIDLEQRIRSTDNKLFTNGYETRELCEERLAELEAGTLELSRRNACPLDVIRVDRPGDPQ